MARHHERHGFQLGLQSDLNSACSGRVTSPLEQMLGYLADHRVRRVEDVAEVVFDALTEERVCAPGVQTVVFLEPA